MAPPPRSGLQAAPGSAPLAALRPTRRRSGLDPATVIGLLGALALIAGAIAIGGSAPAFVDPSALMIVAGGTVLTTMVSFSLGDLAATRSVLGKALVRPGVDARTVARQMLQLADFARRSGALSLQSLLPELRGDGFLRHAVTLIVEGLPADDVERILRTDLEAQAARHIKGASVLRRAAEVAPVMGLIGTLVGLVQMLRTLDDPGAIGPSMAIALLTTFYGAVLGSVILGPLAAKLERNSDEELLLKTLVSIGAASIARQENPRRLEMLLNTVLSPAERVEFFD